MAGAGDPGQWRVTGGRVLASTSEAIHARSGFFQDS
jgi:hypothetical protein